jgi:hypothetical protein
MWRNVKGAWLLPISALVAGCATSPAGPTSPAAPSQQSTVYQSLAISSALSPSPRDSEAMSYFPPGKELVLFGGAHLYGHGLGDTWAFDRHGWRQLHPPTSPPARAQSAIAYDLSFVSSSSMAAAASAAGRDIACFKTRGPSMARPGAHSRLSALRPTSRARSSPGIRQPEHLSCLPHLLASGRTLPTGISTPKGPIWDAGRCSVQDGRGMAPQRGHPSSSRPPHLFQNPDRRRCCFSRGNRIRGVVRWAGAVLTQPGCCIHRRGRGMAALS